MMKKQNGMVTSVMLLVLFTGVSVCAYFWWNEREQRLVLSDDVKRLTLNLKSSRNDVQDQINTLKSERSANLQLKQQIQQLEGDVTKYQSDIEKIQLSETQANNDLSSLKQQMAVSQSALEKEKKTLLNEQQSLSEKNNALIQEKSTLATENAELIQSAAALEKILSKVESELSQSQAANRGLQQQVLTNKQAFDNEKQALMSNNKQLDETVKKLR